MPDRLDDSILLKIHRQFKKDEAVKALVSEIIRQRAEIGLLKDEKADLKKQIKVQKPVSKKINPEWNKDEYIIELLKQIDTHKRKRTMQLQNTKHWQKLYFNKIHQAQ